MTFIGTRGINYDSLTDWYGEEWSDEIMQDDNVDYFYWKAIADKANTSAPQVKATDKQIGGLSAFDTQISGSHYEQPIQPVEYALANQMPYAEATVLKYISRWKLKNGIDDLNKAIHFLQMLKEHAETNPEMYGLNGETLKPNDN